MPRKTRKTKPSSRRVGAYKTKTRKRRSYRVSRKSKSRGLIGPFSQKVASDPFPPHMFCKLSYVYQDTLTVGTTGLFGTAQVFRLNSIYDPDYTGVGHQPYGHDQLALLYNSYKVHGCMVEITAVDPSQDGLTMGARVIPPGVTNTLAATYPAYAGETPMTAVRLVNNTGKQMSTIKQYIPMYKALNISKLQYTASSASPYSARFGYDPTDIVTLNIAVADIRGGSSATMVVRVKLTYYVQVYGRLVLSPS